jgi:hypothetical protein
MMEALISSETSIVTRAIRRNISGDAILHVNSLMYQAWMVTDWMSMCEATVESFAEENEVLGEHPP